MRTFGLIGYPLSHSFSQKYFTEKFITQNIGASQYLNFPLENIERFVDLIREQELNGLNVTIPYKEAVIPYLNKLDETAQAVGAVNTITFRKGKLIGYNTDVIGFEKSLITLLKPNHTHALILGTGGAAKGIAYVLEKLKIDYKYVSRKPLNHQLAYDDLKADILHKYSLIINTTPLGMSPNIDTYPNLPYHEISSQHLCYDLVYNPSETLFLTNAKKQGATIKNGLEMLILQAEAAWMIWNKK